LRLTPAAWTRTDRAQLGRHSSTPASTAPCRAAQPAFRQLDTTSEAYASSPSAAVLGNSDQRAGWAAQSFQHRDRDATPTPACRDLAQDTARALTTRPAGDPARSDNDYRSDVAAILPANFAAQDLMAAHYRHIGALRIELGRTTGRFGRRAAALPVARSLTAAQNSAKQARGGVERRKLASASAANLTSSIEQPALFG